MTQEYPLFNEAGLCPTARYVGGTSRYLCECEDPEKCLGVWAVEDRKSDPEPKGKN